METRYNLELCKRQRKQQHQNQNQQNKDNKDKQDKNKDKNKDQNKDQQDQQKQQQKQQQEPKAPDESKRKCRTVAECCRMQERRIRSSVSRKPSIRSRIGSCRKTGKLKIIV